MGDNHLPYNSSNNYRVSVAHIWSINAQIWSLTLALLFPSHSVIIQCSCFHIWNLPFSPHFLSVPCTDQDRSVVFLSGNSLFGYVLLPCFVVSMILAWLEIQPGNESYSGIKENASRNPHTLYYYYHTLLGRIIRTN